MKKEVDHSLTAMSRDSLERFSYSLKLKYDWLPLVTYLELAASEFGYLLQRDVTYLFHSYWEYFDEKNVD